MPYFFLSLPGFKAFVTADRIHGWRLEDDLGPRNKAGPIFSAPSLAQYMYVPCGGGRAGEPLSSRTFLTNSVGLWFKPDCNFCASFLPPSLQTAGKTVVKKKFVKTCVSSNFFYFSKSLPAIFFFHFLDMRGWNSKEHVNCTATKVFSWERGEKTGGQFTFLADH